MIKMTAKIILACLFLASQPLFAQTPQAVVPVEQEPLHRVVFHNKNARIYDAEFSPGVTCLFHKHSFDSVTIAASGGTGMNEILGLTPQQFTAPTGAAWFTKGTNAPYTHRIQNVDTTPLRFIAVEVLASASPPGVPAVLDAVPGHKLVVDYGASPSKSISVPAQTLGVTYGTGTLTLPIAHLDLIAPQPVWMQCFAC